MTNNHLYILIINANDQKAFQKLYYNLLEKLLKLSIGITKCRESSEEIIEDIFVKIWSMRKEKKDIKNIDAFLSISVRNRSVDFLRKKSRITTTDILTCGDLRTMSNPLDDMEYHELKIKVDQAIHTLPPKCKKVFELVRMFGLSYKEAATEMSISPKTVENQLRIAVGKILEHLKKEYGTIEKMAS